MELFKAGFGEFATIKSTAFSARSSGKAIKLPFGHHGGNHPVKNLAEDKVKITSQNNAFAVDAKSLEGSEMEITEVNHTDGSVAGIKHKSLNAWGVQYYPEVALLDKFYASL